MALVHCASNLYACRTVTPQSAVRRTMVSEVLLLRMLVSLCCPLVSHLMFIALRVFVSQRNKKIAFVNNHTTKIGEIHLLRSNACRSNYCPVLFVYMFLVEIYIVSGSRAPQVAAFTIKAYSCAFSNSLSFLSRISLCRYFYIMYASLLGAC